MAQTKSKKATSPSRFLVAMRFPEDVDSKVRAIQKELSAKLSTTFSKTQTYEYLLNKGIAEHLAEHQKQSQELCHNC